MLWPVTFAVRLLMRLKVVIFGVLAGMAVAFYLQLRDQQQHWGIVPGDRRLRKSVGIAQAFAWLNGATEVEPDHLEVLGHVLWDDPQEQPRKLAEIVGAIANPTGMKINGLLMEAEQVIAEANLSNLAESAAVTKKLQDILKQFKGISGTRADAAKEYLADKIKEIKLAAVELL